jgi:outer membrane protein assembly factor BamB
VPVGEGYASPVVGGGLAFVHSRQDPQEVVTAVEIATGKVRWRDDKYAMGPQQAKTLISTDGEWAHAETKSLQQSRSANATLQTNSQDIYLVLRPFIEK